MTKLQLTNTFSHKKEEFITLTENKVLLYACGVTPYDYAHIGHGRSFVHVDTLVRFLRFLDYDVTFVRNITDIDDKILAKAKKAGDIMNYKSISQFFIDLYNQEMKLLNCLKPDFEPKVTEHIDRIIEFVQGLVKKGSAYIVDHDVYFDVASFEDYGKLSGKNLEELQAGARVEINEKKRNSADFVLWKGNDEDLFWKSPWGYGRPGWHIECSALAKEYLGESIDIHCGGMDLIFPHHENERAQSESLHNKIFAKYWVHNALLNIDKEKMSKSLGNILSLKEIFEKYDPMVLRYYFLQHQYRTPIEFSFEMLDSAKVAYKKLINLFELVTSEEQENTSTTITNEAYTKHAFLAEMVDALCDDLNMPKLLGVLFENLGTIRAHSELKVLTKKFLQQVTGLTFDSLEKDNIEITPEIENLIKKREEARESKNWKVADEIREQLVKLGYEIQDKKIS